MDLQFREGTDDLRMIEEVLRDNEYNLPDSLPEGEAILDIGAHIGAFATACLLRGARHILCLEPDPDSFALLTANCGHVDEMVLYERAICGPGYEHLVRLQQRGHLTAMSSTTERTGIAVEGMSLDELIALAMDATGHGRVRLLKIDCEGAEYEALYQCHYLDFVDEIVGEAHFLQAGPCQDYRGRYQTMCAAGLACFLVEQGFKVTVTEQWLGHPGVNTLFFAERLGPPRHARLLERQPRMGPGVVRLASGAAGADKEGQAVIRFPAGSLPFSEPVSRRERGCSVFDRSARAAAQATLGERRVPLPSVDWRRAR